MLKNILRISIFILLLTVCSCSSSSHDQLSSQISTTDITTHIPDTEQTPAPLKFPVSPTLTSTHKPEPTPELIELVDIVKFCFSQDNTELHQIEAGFMLPEIIDNGASSCYELAAQRAGIQNPSIKDGLWNHLVHQGLDPSNDLPKIKVFIDESDQTIEKLGILLTPTPEPIPTVNPNGDPDGDGYITLFEEVWGTDPFKFTSFEDLSIHPGTIYAKMRVSQPFEVQDMNGTFYQVVRIIEIDDNGTPEDIIDDHITFEVVQFPYAKYNPEPMTVDGFPINPNEYPSDVQQYLLSFENDFSNITDDIKTTMLEIVNGTGEGYETQAKSDVEAVDRIIKWNKSNLKMDPIYESYYPLYRQIVSMRSGDMFETKLTRMSSTRATILNAELKSIGIPTKIFSQVSSLCNPNEDKNCLRGGHPQNGVYLGGQWILYDFNDVDPREGVNYEYLVITDTYRDNSEAIFDYWISVVDVPRLEYPFYDLYYVIELRRN